MGWRKKFVHIPVQDKTLKFSHHLCYITTLKRQSVSVNETRHGEICIAGSVYYVRELGVILGLLSYQDEDVVTNISTFRIFLFFNHFQNVHGYNPTPGMVFTEILSLKIFSFLTFFLEFCTCLIIILRIRIFKFLKILPVIKHIYNFVHFLKKSEEIYFERLR